MKKKRQKSSYDFFNEDFYKCIFHEMQSMIEDLYFIERLQKILRRKLGVSKQLTYDSNTNVLPVWNPVKKEINYYTLKTENKELMNFIENAQLIDIMERDADVTVTVEIPTVEKNNIDLYITANSLEIIIDSSLIKYNKMLKLPYEVNAETAEATFKNGVLDIVIKKKMKN